jgi:hypothetical protein
VLLYLVQVEYKNYRRPEVPLKRIVVLGEMLGMIVSLPQRLNACSRPSDRFCPIPLKKAVCRRGAGALDWG